MKLSRIRSLLELIRLEEEIANLREQFYVTLRAYVAHIEAAPPPQSPALERVRELLAPDRRPRWSECYEVEQLLIHLFDEPMLRTEVEVRLLEAQANLSPTHFEYYASSVKAAADDTQRLRALLVRLVNDLQWRCTVEEGKRRFSKSLTTRSGVAFLFALLAFGGLAAVSYSHNWVFKGGDLRLLAVAAVSGTWGATFSMLTGLSERIEKSKIYDLNVTRAITMVIARALVGAGAACVLFMFFCSGVLSGTVFPPLAGASGVALASSTLALLVIWCFIAGFSEKLVPSLLARTESSASEQAEQPLAAPQPGRYRPSEPSSAPPAPNPELAAVAK